jgi:hypothetical protein
MLTRDGVYCEITVTDNATATPDCVIQWKNAAEQDVTEPVVFIAYLSTDADGQALAVDSTDTTDITVLTDGTILIELVADIMFIGISEADGDFGLTVTIASGKSVYLNVVNPATGVRTVSDLLTYS